MPGRFIHLAEGRQFVRDIRDVDIRGLGDDHLELVDCVFTGKLRTTVFWDAAPQPEAEKRYQWALRLFAREGRPEPSDYRKLARRPSNEFRGNDFSGAELIDVSFRGIDLSQQRRPGRARCREGRRGPPQAHPVGCPALVPPAVQKREKQPFTFPVSAYLAPGRPLWHFTMDVLEPTIGVPAGNTVCTTALQAATCSYKIDGSIPGQIAFFQVISNMIVGVQVPRTR
ncbi:hypothetical protein [Actinoplanes sp. NPDC049681]|uniref:hypothetical protein n=1 Tax=Actinoplanes sp. NPDC049681 TaxID=3363905 RepID=UPI0037A1E201